MKQTKWRRLEKKNASVFVLELVVLILIAGILLVNLFSFGFSLVRYYGKGMEPALHARELLLVMRTDRIEEGDLIAFYYNDAVMVRRVICGGGNQVSIERDGRVMVNRNLLEESYVHDFSVGQCNIDFPCHVPVDHYFVMGDNRSIAMDSRLEEIGCVSQGRVLGKVLVSIGNGG